MTTQRTRTSTRYDADEDAVVSRGLFDSNPASASEEDLLDEDEQREIVQGFEKQAASTNKIYRVFFSAASVLLAVVFLYFAYLRMDFNENIGPERAQIVHALTAIGFLLCAFRVVKGRRPFFSGEAVDAVPLQITHHRPPSILSPEQVANMFGSGSAYVSSTPKKSIVHAEQQDTSLLDDEIEITTEDSPQRPQTSPSMLQQQQQQPTPLSAASTASAAPSSHASLSSNHSSPYLSPNVFIQELQKAAMERASAGLTSGGLSSTGLLGSAASSLAGTPLGSLVQQGRSIDLFFLSALGIALITLMSWTGVMYSHYERLASEGPIDLRDVKLHLFVFPWILPLFVFAIEFVLKVMNATQIEIQDLYGLMYRHKKA